MAILPQSLRSLTPARLRDDVRLRALAVGLGLIPPRTMHSAEDARVLLEAAGGARRVVEIGVYEGASALTLQRALGPRRRAAPDRPLRAPPRRAAGRMGGQRARDAPAARARRAAPGAARLPSCTGTSRSRTRSRRAGRGQVDLVFIDGDHSRGRLRARLAGLEPVRRRRRPRRLPRRARRSARRARPARPDRRRRRPPAVRRIAGVDDRRRGRPDRRGAPDLRGQPPRLDPVETGPERLNT